MPITLPSVLIDAAQAFARRRGIALPLERLLAALVAEGLASIASEYTDDEPTQRALA